MVVDIEALPEELLPLIFAQLRDLPFHSSDPASSRSSCLRACSLVCSAWREPAQAALFRQALVHDRFGACALVRACWDKERSAAPAHSTVPTAAAEPLWRTRVRELEVYVDAEAAAAAASARQARRDEERDNDELEDDDEQSEDDDEDDDDDETAGGGPVSEQMVATILTNLPNIERFKLLARGEIDWDYLSSFLRNIRTLHLSTGHLTSQTDHSLDEYPRLRTLVVDTNFVRPLARLFAPTAASSMFQRGLTYISFARTTDYDTIAAIVLAHSATLQSFSFTNTSAPTSRSRLPSDVLGSARDVLGSALERCHVLRTLALPSDLLPLPASLPPQLRPPGQLNATHDLPKSIHTLRLVRPWAASSPPTPFSGLASAMPASAPYHFALTPLLTAQLDQISHIPGGGKLSTLVVRRRFRDFAIEEWCAERGVALLLEND